MSPAESMAPVDVDVSVLTSGHDVADARLHRQVAALRARGLTVEVLGLGDPTDAPAGASVRTWQRPGLPGRAWLALRQPYLARGRVLLTLDPDSGLAGALATLARRGRARRALVVDVHEDYAALLTDRAWARRHAGVPGNLAKGLVRAGLALTRVADLVVVADEHVPPARARRRMVVRNLPYPGMLPAPGPRGEKPRALYIGDLRASRGLFAMLSALRSAPDWSLDLVGPVAPRDQGRLDRELADDADLASRIRLHGRMPPERAWRVAEGAWAGLSLLADTAAFAEAVPSKLYEYVACGLPVVATDLPRQAALVREKSAGVVVPPGDDAAVGAAVSQVLRAWAVDPTRLDAMRQGLAVEGAQAREQRTPYDELADAVAALADLAEPDSPPSAEGFSRPRPGPTSGGKP